MNNRALTHFRQLCSLGLSSKTLMPSLFETMHEIIPCHSIIFIWYGPEGLPIDFYSDIFAPDVMHLFHAEYEDIGNSFSPNLPTISHQGKPIGNLAKMPKSFYQSSMYNHILRPVDQHYMLDGLVLDQQQSRGLVILFREKTDDDFDNNDVETLKSILPHFNHMLRNEKDNSLFNLARSNERGMIIATPEGKINYISQEAKAIVYMSLNEDCSDPLANRYFQSREETGHKLNRLVNFMSSRLLENLDVNKKATVRYGEAHIRGRSEYEAFWLDNMQGDQGGLIGITVELHLPSQLLTMDRLKQLPLSPRQKDVCILLGASKQPSEICQALGISNTTYKDHVQKIYNKLNIKRRDELMEILR